MGLLGLRSTAKLKSGTAWASLLDRFSVSEAKLTAWSKGAKCLSALAGALPVVSPLDGTPYPPVHLDARYLEILKSALSREGPECFAALIGRARGLLGHQITFGRLLDEWDDVLAGQGLADARTILFAESDMPEASVVRPLMALDAMTHLGRKWSLDVADDVEAPGHKEVVALLHLGALSRTDAMSLILADALESETIDPLLSRLAAFDGPHLSLPPLAADFVAASVPSKYLDGWRQLEQPSDVLGKVVVVGKADAQTALRTLATLWSRGATVDWSGLLSLGRFRFCSLPDYPFEDNRFPISRRDFSTADAEQPVEVGPPGEEPFFREQRCAGPKCRKRIGSRPFLSPKSPARWNRMPRWLTVTKASSTWGWTLLNCKR